MTGITIEKMWEWGVIREYQSFLGNNTEEGKKGKTSIISMKGFLRIQQMSK